MSEAKLHLVKRLAALVAMIEEIEASFIAGKKIDMDCYLSMVNASVRLTNTIGVARKSKIVPDLDDYLKGKRPSVIDHDTDEEDD